MMFSIIIYDAQGDEVVICRKKVGERRVLMETQWACGAFVSTASCNIESFYHGESGTYLFFPVMLLSPIS